MLLRRLRLPMSKSAIKKFRKNDFSHDEDDMNDTRKRFDKRKDKRVERALKTKDISTLIHIEENDDFEDDFFGVE